MVRFAPGTGQRFLVTVDTEEEFDWTKPLTRAAHRVDTVSRLRKFQQFCEGYGVVPIYLIDYPVAMSELAGELLRGAVAEGRAEVGVQLHPWVNPPFEEDVNQFNSFSGNLPYELERAKFRKLYDAIATNFGTAPLIYRAGRYGIGPNTASILREAGLAIDTSVRSGFDYSAHGGPDYKDLPLEPWWVGQKGQLMELPLTTVFTGPLRRYARWLYPQLGRIDRLRGVFARLGLLERIPLTPEGVRVDEALRATQIAIDDGLPVLVLSFHSPSLCPGHTPYVRSEEDLDLLYDWWRKIFELMLARGVQPGSVQQIMQTAELA
ncbi:WalW protein [Novosphingobium umbonatum]|uniref:WalW protein n=1 Tax=Novosphingobium umbonatum TaxID=1908524 RepID=A0A3S2V3D9_9SPHN|nr:polysaccharide deacetylase family protein [Novosphingobium umbonatum]RVU02328.1 WalW protein [Novosphingobium umbonatum]